MRKLLISSLFALALLLVVPFCTSHTAAASEIASAGTVATASTRLNVRSSPSISGTVIGGLAKGTTVTLAGKSGDWWKVEYAAGRFGYCSDDYIAVLPTRSARVSADGYRLNIRSGPSTAYGVVSQFWDGTGVTVLSSSGGWAKVLYAGTGIGYVSEEFLTYASSGTPAVSLSVPYYSQLDPRWANLRLGSSRYTVGSAGCTTTAMAMVESTVRGYPLTPAGMVKELGYSSSGNLYWPSTYSPYTGTDYLSVIYRQLKAGRPVMIGGFTPAGAQHWVVVTGFTGGDLKAENFTVHDPGSGGRKTLGEFQSKYSVFYKIMIRG